MAPGASFKFTRLHLYYGNVKQIRSINEEVAEVIIRNIQATWILSKINKIEKLLKSHFKYKIYLTYLAI